MQPTPQTTDTDQLPRTSREPPRKLPPTTDHSSGKQRPRLQFALARAGEHAGKAGQGLGLHTATTVATSVSAALLFPAFSLCLCRAPQMRPPPPASPATPRSLYSQRLFSRHHRLELISKCLIRCCKRLVGYFSEALTLKCTDILVLSLSTYQ